MSGEPSLRILGVRHHGPGSARSLLAALRDYQPDAVLVEGPPEGEELLPFVMAPEMVPPVALLAYVPDQPQRAAFFPFAEFSPEWQALRYGLGRGIPVRFIDLPQRHWLAIDPSEPAPDTPEPAELVAVEPLDALAVAAGFADGERWWEHLVEERPQPAGEDEGGASADVFAAVMEMMAALRGEGDDRAPGPDHRRFDALGPIREAAMRQAIRTAQREGCGRIAVVCGAWHAPALDLLAGNRSLPSAKDDAASLKELPKTQVRMTWVAWGYQHLSRFSGYGAGAVSPGWYEHLWQYGGDAGLISIRWLTRVAQLLRNADLDASAAQVVDAARLADALAAMRGRPRPGLDELNEAALTILCFGNPLPMQVIARELIIGTRLGKAPQGVPMVPLLEDLASAERRLRFPRQMDAKEYDLDLRQANDLARSQLLHRLLLLDVPWGQREDVPGARGSFHELWTVQWQPGYTVTMIERAVWGNTVAEAAGAFAQHRADTAPDLATLTGLLDRALLADLNAAAAYLIARVRDRAALSSDIGPLMDALPALTRTVRYGNVRQDAAAISERAKSAIEPAVIAAILDGLVARICIGLPLACSSLADDAAEQMLVRIEGVHGSLGTAGTPVVTEMWWAALAQLANQAGLHGLLAGRCCRLLLEKGLLGADETGRRLSLALSRANDPLAGAAWLEGLLRGSGLLLLHEGTLWDILDGWVAGLSTGNFTAVLPLLRRTFSAFPPAERRQMGERARRGSAGAAVAGVREAGIDLERADAALPLLALLLGVPGPGGSGTSGERP